MSGLHADFALDWGDDERMLHAKSVQDAICSSPQPIHAIAYPQDGETPPYAAHVYLVAHTQCFAGIVYRNDRWPTCDEISSALTEWRSGIVFTVRWWTDP